MKTSQEYVRAISYYKLFAGWRNAKGLRFYRPSICYISMPGRCDDLDRATCIATANNFFKKKTDALDVLYLTAIWDKKAKKYYFRKTEKKGCDAAIVFKKADREKVSRYMFTYCEATEDGDFT